MMSIELVAERERPASPASPVPLRWLVPEYVVKPVVTLRVIEQRTEHNWRHYGFREVVGRRDLDQSKMVRPGDRVRMERW